MKKSLLVFLAVIVLIIPTTVFAQDMELNPNQPADQSLKQNPQNQAAAVVNGEKISVQELSQQLNINQMLQQVSQTDQQLAQILASSEAGKQVLEELQQEKLDSLIDNLLLKQQVEEEEISLTQSEKNEIYKQQKKSVMQQNKMSEKQFISVLEKQGFASEAAYKKEFFKNPQIKINKLVETKVLTDIKVSEQELQAAYDKNKDALAETGQDISYEDVKGRLKRMLKNQKQSQAVNKYLNNLREDAEITKNI